MRKIRAGGSPGRSFLILAGPDAAVCTTATLEHGLSHGTQGSVRLRAPRSGAQTVVMQRVWGGVGRAFLGDGEATDRGTTARPNVQLVKAVSLVLFSERGVLVDSGPAFG